MTAREHYIVRLAVLLADGNDDPAATEAEHCEALALLSRAGIAIPEFEEMTEVA